MDPFSSVQWISSEEPSLLFRHKFGKLHLLLGSCPNRRILIFLFQTLHLDLLCYFSGTFQVWINQRFQGPFFEISKKEEENKPVVGIKSEQSVCVVFLLLEKLHHPILEKRPLLDLFPLPEECPLPEENNRGLLVFLHIHIHHLLQMEEQ